MPDIMRMGSNPRYLASWDLDDLPDRELVLEIGEIVDEVVFTGGAYEVCTVMYFTNTQAKPMILNMTNKKTLCKLHGTKDTEELRGKPVIIGVDQVRVFGGIYDALRIRLRLPQTDSGPACEVCGKEIPLISGLTSVQTAAYLKRKRGKCECVDCLSRELLEEEPCD